MPTVNTTTGDLSGLVEDIRKLSKGENQPVINVEFDPVQLLVLGSVIFGSIFLAVVLGNYISK